MRARLASILLLTLVATGSAAADRAAKGRVGKVTLRVAQVFPETGQALVLDKTTGRHLVVSEGDTIGKYQIVEVGDDEVVVRSGTRELVLPSDEPARVDREKATAPDATAEGPLLDPYAVEAKPVAASTPSAAGPLLDPYAPEPIREVLAPEPQRAVPSGGPVARPSPVGSSPDGSPTRDARLPRSEAPLDPYASEPAAPKPPVATPAPVVTPAPTPAVEVVRVETQTIKRDELSAALADFDRLSKTIGFTRTATGVRLGKVDAGTYFYGLGLRTGDVVTAIDGAPLRGLDDAAGAYARLGSAKKLALDVERAGARGTLRFALK